MRFSPVCTEKLNELNELKTPPNKICACQFVLIHT
jgi:hypothetical protein